jgi:23S rRNA pseudouridine2605 synthase
MNKIKNEQTMQLNKYLALAGVASRRKAADLIKQGTVTVNGVMINEPGYAVKTVDKITYKGVSVHQEKKIYIVLNKPKNYITTNADQIGRRTVLDLLKPKVSERIYPIGRLDRNTTGVLLLTNDGEFAQQLAHPQFMVQKVYHVALDRTLKSADAEKLVNGVTLEDGDSYFDELHYPPDKQKNHIMVSIHSGKNRVIRRMFEALGYAVKKLDRISFAGVTKQGIMLGQWRLLNAQEISALKAIK